MKTDPNCVFCKIIAGQIPSLRVFEDEAVLAFLDIGPLAEGHLLIVPKEHHEHLEDMPETAVCGLTRHLPRLVKVVMKVVNAQGCNVLLNNRKVAGQDVPHVHWHIVPRVDSDGLGYRWKASRYPSGRAERIQQSIRDALERSNP